MHKVKKENHEVIIMDESKINNNIFLVYQGLV